MNKSITLSQITTSIFDGKHGDCENLKGSGLYFISVKDLSDYNINYYNAREITPNDFEQNYKRTNLEEGDTIYANTGDTIGKSIFVKNNKLVSKTSFQKSIAVLKPNINIIEPRYLYYLMKYETPRLRKVATGSGQKNLLLSTMRDFKVTIHDRKRQKQICSLLGLLDDKIEINNKINDELENMAKTIYDYWFLQFEFPNEDGKPYKSSGGKMVWNEELKREIPEGWDVQTLENLGNLIMGQSPKSTSYNNKKEGLPLINGAAELQKDKIEITKYTSEPTRICKKEDLIFCIRATIGNINYADKSYCLGRGVGAFRVTEKEYVEYMFLTLRNILNMYNKILTGSIIVGITKEDLLQQNIIKPKNDVITQFYNKVHFMAEKMKSIKKENQELTALRDFLLPLLMNGQVGFKEDKA